MSSHWDKLAVSTPLNATAGRVTSTSRGLQPAGPRAAETYLVWKTAPQTTAVPRLTEDLTGRQIGRLTVAGYLGNMGTDKGKWLVRCSCGDFEVRNSKAVKNPANSADACKQCRHVEFLKRSNTSNTHRSDGSRAAR